MNTPDHLHIENAKDSENYLNVLVENGRLCIAVANEQAIDSYNATVECEISISADEAKLLRDYLNKHFPR